MAASESAEPATEREFALTRVYDAPARLLFEAWSKPEHSRNGSARRAGR
jgi:uncharacterized protein YndB with AHSA1/START domain